MSIKPCQTTTQESQNPLDETPKEDTASSEAQAKSLGLAALAAGASESDYGVSQPHAGVHLSSLESRKKVEHTLKATDKNGLHPFEPLENVVRYDETEQTKKRQFGTHETLASLKRLNRNMKLLVFLNESEKPGRVDVGDISLKNGAAYGGHQTHRRGRDVDMRPAATVYQNKSIGSFRKNPTYSEEKTQVLVDLLRMDPNVKRVLFNDSRIQGVSRAEGHDDHLHVSFEK